jgi:hypothetical protein
LLFSGALTHRPATVNDAILDLEGMFGCVGGIFAVIAVLVYAWLRTCSIRVRRVGKGQVRLSGVAPEFVEAMRLRRQAAIGDVSNAPLHVELRTQL